MKKEIIYDTLQHTTKSDIYPPELIENLTIRQALGMGVLIGMVNMFSAHEKPFEQTCEYLAKICKECDIKIDVNCVPDEWFISFVKFGILPDFSLISCPECGNQETLGETIRSCITINDGYGEYEELVENGFHIECSKCGYVDSQYPEY